MPHDQINGAQAALSSVVYMHSGDCYQYIQKNETILRGSLAPEGGPVCVTLSPRFTMLRVCGIFIYKEWNYRD